MALARIRHLFLFLLISASLTLAADKPRLQVQDYQIEAEILPAGHRLVAKAVVKFTATDDISVAIFELHNGLKPRRITDEKGNVLSAERVSNESQLRVSLAETMAKGTPGTLTFEYEGVVNSVDDSPVEGLKLAQVDNGTSYLLYAARWFPVSGYGLNRFTATMNITVPAGWKVAGSGVTNPIPKPQGNKVTWNFVWNKPSFPGTIIAGEFEEFIQRSGGLMVRAYVKPDKKDFAPAYVESALKELEFFSSLFGPAPSTTLNLVELPNDTLPTAWAPELAAMADRAFVEKTNYRLLANTVARQWWGVQISPTLRGDTWISEGGARYAEVRYVEQAAGQGGFEEATKDIAVGALAYDTIPLSSVGRLELFSPEFQSLVTDKGAMIFHMLRWVMHSDRFDQAMHALFEQFSGKTIGSEELRKLTEKIYGEPLTSFYAQWLDGTGAPEFKNKYTVYRIKKGFRVVGEVTQDLDLFRMPMEIKVDTDGNPEIKRIEVVGTRSPYSIETFGKPRKITLDPNNWVMKESPELKVRIAILRGQQAAAQGDYPAALTEYNKALDENKLSSLAQYRIAEIFFQQRNYQASANAYRDALNGDGEPRWTEVWSHIQLGKIFDVTGQRDRAVNEYRQAIQTNDNTEGAMDEARKFLENPFQRERSTADN